MRLDFKHPVLHPDHLVLLHMLGWASVAFWPREFEELYQAFDNWDDAAEAFKIAQKRGEVWEADGVKMKEEWEWTWFQFVLLPVHRRRYLHLTALAEVPELNSLPPINSHSPVWRHPDLGAVVLTPARWLALLRAGVYEWSVNIPPRPTQSVNPSLFMKITAASHLCSRVHASCSKPRVHASPTPNTAISRSKVSAGTIADRPVEQKEDASPVPTTMLRRRLKPSQSSYTSQCAYVRIR